MSSALNVSPQEQSEILMQALPHMLRYDDSTIVVKYGGHAMGGEGERDFARDMVLLEQSGVNPVVVHGGGPQIGAMLKKLGSESARKVTRPHEGGDGEPPVDLGFVGEPDKIDVTVLEAILGRELIPVLAPVAAAADGETYNVNADTFAGAIAGALTAKRLLFLTDVPGVLDKDKNLIKELNVEQIRELIADGTITGGMIPKVETCIYAVERGVEGVVILDGKIPHAVLIELLTDHGAGTLITR
jgi:acetylglutamate kinase